MTTESLAITIEGEVLTVEIGTVAAPAGGGSSAWGGITGTLSAQTDLQSALDLKAPLASPTLTGTPAAPTAAGATSTTQIATTAFVGGEITTHAGAADPHGDRSFATSAVSTHNAVTTAHGITAFGASLVDDANAAAARTTLGLGTAAVAATGDFAAASHAHAAADITSGTLVHERGGLEADVSLYSGLVKITGGVTSAVTVTTAGEALLDDASAADQRTTLGLTALATTTPGTGVATFLATPSSANLAAAVTDETGSGALVFATSPTLVTPALGTPASGVLTNCTFPTLNQNTTGYAEALKSATTTVSVSAATAPSSGQVLTATSSTAATWQAPSGGLSEPLASLRFTGQTSAPAAASSGEVKAYVRQLGKAFAAAYRGEVGDSILLLPSISHPLVRGMWVTSSTTSTTKCWAAFTSGSGFTTAAHTVPSLLAINMPTAATGNTNVGRGINGSTLRDGTAFGDGFLMWGLASFPDADYGSGATGTKFNVGAQASGAFSSNGNRPGARCAGFEFNTNQADTNWQAIVYDTAARVVDTGLVFTVQKTYLWMVFLPRSATSTYFYIHNLDDGTSGSATVAYTPGSTAMGEYLQLVTLTTTARNVRVSDMFTLVGGAI